jgi:hypothetical protein
MACRLGKLSSPVLTALLVDAVVKLNMVSSDMLADVISTFQELLAFDSMDQKSLAKPLLHARHFAFHRVD